MENEKPASYILYGPGTSIGLIEKMAARTSAIEIPTSQNTYIPQGQPFAEFWPGVAGWTEEQVVEEKRKLEGKTVTIVQAVGRPYAENFYYAKLAANNAKRFGAAFVHMIFPFYDLREDKDFPQRGTSFANPMAAAELAMAGVDYVTFIAPHSKAGVTQFAKVFGRNISTVELPDIMIPIMREKFGSNIGNLANGAPDGWNKQTDQAFSCAVQIAKELHGEETHLKHMFGIEKIHHANGETNSVSFTGDVKGKTVVSADDMFDGGSTSIDGGKLADKAGAAEIYLAAPHGIFSKGLARFLAARNEAGGLLVKQVITTNTLKVEDAITAARSQFPNIRERMAVYDVSPFIERERLKVLENLPQHLREAKSIPRPNFGQSPE